MKKQMALLAGKVNSILVKALMAAMVLLNTNFAHAQVSTPPFNNPELKYLGTADGRFIFQVDFQRPTDETFIIEIKDQDDYQLYYEKSKARNFKKQFAVEKSDLDNNTLTVVVSHGGFQKKFDINKSMRTIEDIRIVKQ